MTTFSGRITALLWAIALGSLTGCGDPTPKKPVTHEYHGVSVADDSHSGIIR